MTNAVGIINRNAPQSGQPKVEPCGFEMFYLQRIASTLHRKVVCAKRKSRNKLNTARQSTDSEAQIHNGIWGGTMKRERPIPNRPLTFNRATFFHVLIASATVYRIVRRNQSAYTKYLGKSLGVRRSW